MVKSIREDVLFCAKSLHLIATLDRNNFRLHKLNRKELIMKRISSALLIASLSSISGPALSASDSVFPSAGWEHPPIRATETYMDRNRESARTQTILAGPAGAAMFDPIQSVDTYMLRHLDDIETQASVPFPSSGGSIGD